MGRAEKCDWLRYVLPEDDLGMWLNDRSEARAERWRAELGPLLARALEPGSPRSAAKELSLARAAAEKDLGPLVSRQLWTDLVCS